MINLTTAQLRLLESLAEKHRGRKPSTLLSADLIDAFEDVFKRLDLTEDDDSGEFGLGGDAWKNG